MSEVVHQHRSLLNCATTFRRDRTDYALIGTCTSEAILFKRDGEKIEDLWSIVMQQNAIKSISADDRLVFSVSADVAVAIFSTPTLEQISFLPPAHDKVANGYTALGAGVFASVSRNLKLRIWKSH